MTKEGFVARDLDGDLYFHYTEPRRMNDVEKTWWGSNDMAFRIYDFEFPEFKDLKWESEPVRVKLTIEKA